MEESNYEESEESDQFDEAQLQAKEIAKEIFETKIWPNYKQEIKEVSRKDASRFMFSAGFMGYMSMMDQEIKELKKDAEENPEEFDEIIDSLKKTIKENE